MQEILINDQDQFHNDYNLWRINRVCKVEKILGTDWFVGKTVHELGCGYGRIGAYFNGLGANVTASDARQSHIDFVKEKYSIETFLIDQDQIWNLERPVDLIIHFGVLYHLKNWKEDLRSTARNSKQFFLETVVADTDDPFFEHTLFEEDEGGQNAYNGIGTVMSAANVERVLNDIGCTFVRYDDEDLSTPNKKLYQYHWTVSNNIQGYETAKTFEDKPLYGGRRFWLVNSPPSIY